MLVAYGFRQSAFAEFSCSVFPNIDEGYPLVLWWLIAFLFLLVKAREYPLLFSLLSGGCAVLVHWGMPVCAWKETLDDVVGKRGDWGNGGDGESFRCIDT